MKNLKKVAIVLVISLIVFSMVTSNSVFATTMLETIKTQAVAGGETSVVNPVKNIAGSIITIARVVCAAVAVTMLVMVAIKYMSAAPGEKADIKKHAVIYIVGAVVMFACTGILGIIEQFAGVLEK